MLALQSHTVSLQKAENKCIQTDIKCLEMILTIPTNSYSKQVAEDQRLVNLKKLSNKIML